MRAPSLAAVSILTLAGCSSSVEVEDVDPLTIPDGLTTNQGPEPVLVAPVKLDFTDMDAFTATFPEDFTVTSIQVDKDAETFTIGHVIAGEPETVTFTPEDIRGENDWGKEYNEWNYWMWEVTDTSEYAYVSAIHFGAHNAVDLVHRAFFVSGPRTEAGNLPEGEATYDGYMRAESWRRDNPRSSEETRDAVYGDVHLSADFAAGTVAGSVDGLLVKAHGTDERVPLAEDARFVIDEGRIVDGQYTANLTGMGSDHRSVSGMHGGVAGEFYGPAAEETGAVFNAMSDEWILVGTFVTGSEN